MENDQRTQKLRERLKYRPYEICANRIGVLMIIQQVIFQVGSIVVLFILLIAEGISRGGFDIHRLVRMLSNTNNVVFDVYLASAIMQIVSGICFLVFFLINKDVIIHAPISGGKMSFSLIISCMLVVLAVNAVITSSGQLIDDLSVSNAVSGLSMGGNKHALGLFFLVAVFPAIVEELFYRGVVFRYLRRGGFGFAAVISSLIFGMVHMNITQLIFAGILGFVLCYLYELTGHIWPGMIIHFVNNAVVLLLTYFQKASYFRICVYAAGFVSLVSLIVLYVLKFRHISVGDRKAIVKGLTTVGMIIFLIIGICICLIQLSM